MDLKVDWSSCLQHAALSDVGMRRSNNQDSSAVVLASDADSWLRRGHLFVVADGMGAHAAGELASKLAAEGIPFNYHKQADVPPPDALRRSVKEANAHIHRRGQANAEFHGMGTTASALVLLPQGALIAHVGDSRIYRLRGTTLEQLTFDHSLVWEMSAAGQVSKEELPAFVPKNIITRSLGPHPDVQVDLEGPYPVEVGDTFLLCTDGLTGQVRDDEIGAILGALPPCEAARVLVDLANLRGGPDNITVIVLRVTGSELTASGRPVEPLAVTEDLASRRTLERMPIVMWVFAAVCLIAGLVLFGMQITMPALVAVAASVVMLVLGFVLSSSPALPEMRYLMPGSRLGKGPHATIECRVDEEFVANLRRLVEQLRDAATEGNWSIDWGKFNTHARNGEWAADNSDYTLALQEFSRAIRFMMQELRNQRAKRADDDDSASALSA